MYIIILALLNKLGKSFYYAGVGYNSCFKFAALQIIYILYDDTSKQFDFI